MAKQKFNVFPEKDVMVCGDCGKVLTKDGHRLEDSYIREGIRCKQCYVKRFGSE